jgi:hypothetical protein
MSLTKVSYSMIEARMVTHKIIAAYKEQQDANITSTS